MPVSIVAYLVNKLYFDLLSKVKIGRFKSERHFRCLLYLYQTSPITFNKHDFFKNRINYSLVIIDTNFLNTQLDGFIDYYPNENFIVILKLITVYLVIYRHWTQSN